MGLFKNFRKQKKEHTKLPLIAKVVIGLFVIGLVFGVFIGFIFEGKLYAPLLTTYSELSVALKDINIDKQAIFMIAVKRSMKMFFLLLLFCITNLWCYYLSAYVLYTGFTNGLLLCFCVMFHHANGVIRYLIYQIPQVIIFLPLYIIIICRCHKLHNAFVGSPDENYQFQKNTISYSSVSKKGKLLFCQFPFVLTSILFLLLGCLLEAYANVPILCWYSSHS